MESEASNSTHFLPAELVTEILLKLPIKSLLKFKCASKSWLALISSPEFIKIHLSLNANNKEYTHHKMVMMKKNWPPKTYSSYSIKYCSLSSLFNESRVTKAKYVDYTFKNYRKRACRLESTPKRNDFSGVSIACSANGLICLVIEDTELFLCNPSIRKYRRLPNPIMDRPIMVRALSQVYGFGYDELHDDYKVVIINEVAIFSSCELKVKIYSLKTDSWTSSEDCPHMALSNVSGKFVNGKLHWDTTICDLYIPNIISFDLADEKWREMEQPCYDEGKIKSRLEVLGSDLSLVCNCNKTHLDVWVMKEYGIKESWTKMFTIKYPENNRYLGQRCLHMTNDGEILVVIGSNFMIYNPKSDSLRYSQVINSGVWDTEEIYVESLVYPFSDDAQIETIE